MNKLATFRFDIAEETADRVVGKVIECTILNRAREMGLYPETEPEL